MRKDFSRVHHRTGQRADFHRIQALEEYRHCPRCGLVIRNVARRVATNERVDLLRGVLVALALLFDKRRDVHLFRMNHSRKLVPELHGPTSKNSASVAAMSANVRLVPRGPLLPSFNTSSGTS